MRIVLVGSGTGGHFYPLIAVAEAVRANDAANDRETDLLFMGPEPYDQAALDLYNITFVSCPAGKQRIYRSFLNYLDVFKTIAGVFVAFFKLLHHYPDVVLSKGGFTSVPVVLAAWILRIPIVLHESDAVAGRANLFAKRFASYIAIAHDEAAKFFPKEKVALVGMPVRKAFLENQTDPYNTLGIPNDRPVIFVIGGSSGAKRINELLLNSLDELLPHYTVVHQTGKAHEEEVRKIATELITDKTLQDRYFSLGYLAAEQIAAAFDAASVIVSRAGSGTLFEIALKGKPSIIIPIPEDISRDQRSNAYAYARSGAATVLEEDNLTDDMLAAEIRYILEEPGVYDKMATSAAAFTKPNAAATIADILLDIGKSHEW